MTTIEWYSHTIQYYENDDPTYYRNKIQYTLKEDVTGADLFYTDSADDVCNTLSRAWGSPGGKEGEGELSWEPGARLS